MIDALGIYLTCGLVLALLFVVFELHDLDLDGPEVALYLARVTLAWPTFVAEELWMIAREARRGDEEE